MSNRIFQTFCRATAISLVAISAILSIRADVVTDWDAIANSTVFVGGLAFPAIQGSRILAMTHAAIHDALNAIDRRYKPYAFDGKAEPGSSPAAAVATAAHDVLADQVPAQKAALDAAYATSLALIGDGPAKSNGILIGHAAAVAVLAYRSADGSSAPMPYTPGTGPGVWLPTPSPFLPAALPGWGQVAPFALARSDQFRPGPSVYFDLTSPEYTADYNEVKAIGDVNSTTRTADQGQIAMFWYEGTPFTWNRIARVVLAQRNLDLWQSARLFALLNFAEADGFISGFEAKYFYNFWRPVTAIRAGDTDNNPNTVPDPNWNTFLVTPNLPDYPSTHSVLAAAAAQVLLRFFDNDNIGYTTTSGLPFAGITRSYTSFTQGARETADSRVYAGIHFRSACRAGLILGAQVGDYAFENTLQPVFDSCLQDDGNGDFIRFNTLSGDYEFIRCGVGGTTVRGRGRVIRANCLTLIEDSQVKISLNSCPIAPLNRGVAVVQQSAVGQTFVIRDRNATNNTCGCR